MIYCIVPRELAGELHDSLRRHFRDDPGVEVVVDRRTRDRRSVSDRRQVANPGDWAAPATHEERRRIRNPGGRRVGERRAPLVPVPPPAPLPVRFRDRAGRLAFVERVERSSEREEDLEAARLVTQVQAGRRDAFAELYILYFDRVYGYLQVLLHDPHEAEDGAQQVFVQLFSAISRYERRGRPFRAYLFTAVRNHALSHLRKSGRVDLEEPGALDGRLEAGGSHDEAPLFALDWIRDRDLLLFVERLPDLQRQVLLMRFMLDLKPAEIGQIIERPAGEVRVIQARAIRFLRQRLAAVGRTPERRRPARARQYLRQAPVLRGRRFALLR